MKNSVPFVLLLVLLGRPATGLAQWTSVGDGIDYQAFTAAGPNRLFVSRMARSNPNTTIDTSIALDRMAGATEIVRNQAARQDDAITWWGGSWGPRNRVVVAINGGFYTPSTGVIEGGQIQSGWYAHWFNDRGAFSGFAWKNDRTAFHGECVDHTPSTVYVRFVSAGSNQTIDGVNRAPGSSDLVIFTPQYDNRTPSGSRTEVLVEMSRPNLTTSGGGYSSGIIRSIRQNSGSNWIPFDHLILSAGGSAGTTLRNNSVVGGEVRIFQELIETNEPTVQGANACQTPTGVNWSNVFSSINTNYHFLKNNVVRVPDAVAHPGYIGYVNLNPRTAICWNTTYVFFVICDGRSTQSVGMSCETLGNWAKSVLGATDGVNLDGGGSSTMVVNGSVVNVPSDGSERPVCNGVLMVNVLPRLQSTQLTAGQDVTVAATANFRLGPGTNYGIMTTLSPGTTGTVLDHAIKGVYAKGFYWWKCDFGGNTGWIAESLLQTGPTPPAITQHPSHRTVAPGGTATFTVAATGSAPLAYQWQKCGSAGCPVPVNLSNAGHYSGATTPTLTVSDADSSDAAIYRCVVTNSHGTATSNEAVLTVAVCVPPTILNAGFEGAGSGGIAAHWTGYTRPEVPSTVVYSIQTASPAEGAQYQQIQTSYVASGGAGVYQTIAGCTSGAEYTISGWMRTNSANGRATVRCAPGGGTSYGGAVDLTPAATTTSSSWVFFSGSITAAASTITLFLDCQTHVSGSTAKAAAFDGLTITGCGSTGPGITQHPSAQNVCPAATAQFTVAADGTGTLTYQWQKCGTASCPTPVNLSNAGHYSGVTTPTLTISNTDAGDVAAYRCVVTDSSGSTNSNSASLSLKSATTISQHPQPQSVPAGGTAVFSVAAGGDGTLVYQWQKNGGDLSDGGHYSGVTTAGLTVSGVDSNDAGNYRCVVTAGCGSAVSNAAALSVGPPAIPGDFDGDQDVDQVDFGHIQECLDPAGGPALDPDCADANLSRDENGNINQTDLLIFLNCMTAPGVAGNPNCAN